MERFEYLHGASSLYIINHFECSYGGELKDDDLCRNEAIRQRIDARLPESGAIDISLEPGSHGHSDQREYNDNYSNETDDLILDEIVD
jgi:hypothetical protein